MAKNRAPKPKANPFNGKSAVEAEPPKDNDRLPPVFSFQFMREGTGYSVECCDVEHRAALSSRFFRLSRMTWLEIRNSPRHGLGTEKIPRNIIRPEIPRAVTEDVELLALRYMGLHPIVGFRDGRIFNVLFIDHTMDAYPH